MRHIIAALAIALLLCSAVQAQDATAQTDTAEGEPRPNLRLIARSYGDSIVLRWGTTSHAAWKVAGRGGYIIERYEMRGGGVSPQRSVLNSSPIRPLTLEEWKARYSPSDTLAGAAVQALYGAPVVTTDDPFGSIYEMYLQQQTTFGFALALADMQPRLADGLGLRYVDRKVEANRTYLYRIYSLANNPDQTIDTAFTVVVAGDVQQTPSVESLAAEEGEREVVLKWDRYEHITPFTGYFIERSGDGGRSFARVNSMPFLPLENPENGTGEGEISYRIKLEQNYRPAQYRVVGVDAFGETSPASRIITAMGRDRTAPHQPAMLPIAIVEGSSVKVSWRMDSLDADLQGFYVGKSEDTDGPYERIGGMLPRDARTFVDRNVADLPQHYYAVMAADTAGNIRYSVPLLAMFPDSIPPAVPAGLSGSIDSNGIVILRWTPNPESDLQGYRVFFANQEDHEFQQLTTDITADTIFTDTLELETLSEEIYYRVTALDRNFNHSRFTAALMLRKPDIVSPAAPIVADLTVSERGVELVWEQSPSSDVAGHTLYRRASEEEAWQPLASAAGKGFTSYTDTSARGGMLYEYSVDAVDDAGHRSLRSNIVAARPLTGGRIVQPGGLTGTPDRANNRIVIRWNATAPAGERIYIYKGAGEEEMSLYQSLDAGATEFSDPDVLSGGTYRYGVKLVSDGGDESAMTTTEPIRYN